MRARVLDPSKLSEVARIALGIERPRGRRGRSVRELAEGAPRAARKDEEHEEQSKLYAWKRDPATLAMYPEVDLLHAIPNLNLRLYGNLEHIAKRWGARLTREGREPGMLDNHLPVARGGWHSLYVEMKTAKGSLSDEQKAWVKKLAKAGNRVEVCRSFEAARDVIVGYLALPKPRTTKGT